MIQDIYPSRFNNSYVPFEIRNDDIILIFDDEGKVLVHEEDGMVSLVNEVSKELAKTYLFSLDEQRFFLAMESDYAENETEKYMTIRDIRKKAPQKTVFVLFTAYHLWQWYSVNKFCGRCGERVEFHASERALQCQKCGNIIYPRINPAVIVGVTRGDEILITKYRRGYAHSALVAGFTEIGETLEETVEREVMEEAGIKVKNIRYYKSQPWGMAQDILAGFFCEVDGDSEIKMDENELKYAAWVKRGDIELQPDNLSLTNEMMKVFKYDEI
ncbi:MAG: NAD(+) diphosphatase [Lachnospiraceae bacterium]|nr:NAD(+) diphosphatase [Lachnospiraceae bacterium]